MSGFDVAGADAIERALARIPPEVWGEDATSLLQLAWCRLLVDRDGFLDALAAVEGAVADPEAAGHAADLGVLRSMAAWLSGDWPACVDHAVSALEPLTDEPPVGAAGRFGWTLAAHGVALDERWGRWEGV